MLDPALAKAYDLPAGASRDTCRVRRARGILEKNLHFLGKTAGIVPEIDVRGLCRRGEALVDAGPRVAAGVAIVSGVFCRNRGC